MIWQAMLYSVAVALALGAAGFCLERVAGLRGLQRRWIWPVTMALSIGCAAGGLLWAEPASRMAGGIRTVPVPQQEMVGIPIVTAGPQEAQAPPRISSSRELRPVPAIDARSGPTWTPPSDRTLLRGWAFISLALLAYLAFANLRLHRQSARWRRATVLGREVLVSESTGPALLGTLQPRIVVPDWFLSEAPARQAVILQHEEQHIAARDPLVLRAALLVSMALPWILPLWWQLRQLRRAIELDCDARVVRRGTSPAAYGEVLLMVARRASAVPVGLVAMGERRSSLERRVRNLLPGAATHSTLRATVAVLMSMICVSAVMALEAPPVRTQASPPVGVETPSTLPRLLPPRSGPRMPGLMDILLRFDATRSAERVQQAVLREHSGLMLPTNDPVFTKITAFMTEDGRLERFYVEYKRQEERRPYGDIDPERFARYFEPLGLQPEQLGAMGITHVYQPAESTADGQPGDARTVIVRYAWRRRPGEALGGRPSSPATEALARIVPFTHTDAAAVLEHYLPGALNENGESAEGTPWLVLSREGEVLRSGYLAKGIEPTEFQAALPDVRLHAIVSTCIVKVYARSYANKVIFAWVKPEPSI